MQPNNLIVLWTFYGVMAAIAVVVDALAPGPSHLVFVVPSQAPWDIALGLAVAAATIIVSEVMDRTYQPARALGRQLANVLGSLRPTHIFWYAFCSGVAEEMLFRGAIQPLLGIWVTSVLFGSIHGFFRRQLWLWSLMAVAMGFAFGWLALRTGSLLAPIVAHFVINLVNLTILMRRYGGLKQL